MFEKNLPEMLKEQVLINNSKFTIRFCDNTVNNVTIQFVPLDF